MSSKIIREAFLLVIWKLFFCLISEEEMIFGEPANPLISVVIVNYKVPQPLLQALYSLREADYYDRTEVIVVDNASGDESEKLVRNNFPEVSWIRLKQNIGFGKACNVASKVQAGPICFSSTPIHSPHAPPCPQRLLSWNSIPKLDYSGRKFSTRTGRYK
jgi:cellulose synthase/poly-beta-1,6-N-acetylglucosamine synthase-like glycosyltransferase